MLNLRKKRQKNNKQNSIFIKILVFFKEIFKINTQKLKVNIFKFWMFLRMKGKIEHFFNRFYLIIKKS